MELIFIDELAKLFRTTPGAIRSARSRQSHKHLDLYNKGVHLGINGKLAWRKADVEQYLDNLFSNTGK